MINSILRLVGGRRPLLVFGLPGVVVLLGGLALGARVISLTNTARALPVGQALVSVSLCIAGAMAMSEGLVLRMIGELRDTLSGRQEVGPPPTYQPSSWTELDWPLVLLGVPGMMVFLTGIAFGVWVIDVFRQTNVLSVGLALVSVSLCLSGELIWLTSIVLHALRELIIDLTGSGGPM
jgi:hypothetical protein